ncbi:MAG: DUF956 family protein [Capnocytophaga leadbetteri]
MAQSQNSSIDLTIKASSFHGLTTYGDVLIGNKAFEFYNEKNPEDYIQIPWDEVDHVAASVIGKGKAISRFAIELPLKILIYEDGKKVNIRYEKIAAMGEKYHIKQNFATAEKIDSTMQQLIKLAIGK